MLAIYKLYISQWCILCRKPQFFVVNWFLFFSNHSSKFWRFGLLQCNANGEKRKRKVFSNLPVFTVFNMQLPCFSDQRQCQQCLDSNPFPPPAHSVYRTQVTLGIHIWSATIQIAQESYVSTQTILETKCWLSAEQWMFQDKQIFHYNMQLEKLTLSRAGNLT